MFLSLPLKPSWNAGFYSYWQRNSIKERSSATHVLLGSRHARKMRDVIDGLSFHSINFNFPSYSKRMLGDGAPPSWTVIHPSRGHSFQLINNTFYGSDGLALQYSGDRAVVQNNLFEYNDWSVTNTRSKSGGLGTLCALMALVLAFVLQGGTL